MGDIDLPFLTTTIQYKALFSRRAFFLAITTFCYNKIFTERNTMQGLVKLYKDGELLFEKHNQIQDGSKVIEANLMAGNTEFRPSALYIEFQNSGTPEAPAFTTAEGLEYYTSLPSGKDYLVIPLVIKPEVCDNTVTFSAVITGGTGAKNGLVCGSSTKAYGAALVSEQAGEIYARMYFDEPITLTDDVQFYLPWTITF